MIALFLRNCRLNTQLFLCIKYYAYESTECVDVTQRNWSARVTDVDAQATVDASQLLTSVTATTIVVMDLTKTQLLAVSMSHS